MPALTKAQAKQAQAAEDSFNRVYAAQYGADRWAGTLYPALAAPTRYALLLNRYAGAGATAHCVLPPEDLEHLRPVAFPGCGRPPLPDPGAGTELSQGGEKKVEEEEAGGDGALLAYQWASADMDKPFPAPPPAPPLPSPAQQKQRHQQQQQQQPTSTTTTTTNNKLSTHWNLDAASLLAASVLAPRPGDRVLDLCAAPGGKSLALAQMLRLADEGGDGAPRGCLHSNEAHPGRHRRLEANLRAYLPAPLFESGRVRVLRLDGSEDGAAAGSLLPLLGGGSGYDRVLVDAPCSSERHVVQAHARARRPGARGAGEEMAAWRSGQSRKAARLQAALLLTALRAARAPGGRVVYATCSLSAEENDAVVDRASELVAKEERRRKLPEEGGGGGWDFVVVSRSAPETSGLEAWAEPTRHGWIVLPDHAAGGRWGPLYFSVLEKVERK